MISDIYDLRRRLANAEDLRDHYCNASASAFQEWEGRQTKDSARTAGDMLREWAFFMGEIDRLERLIKEAVAHNERSRNFLNEQQHQQDQQAQDDAL